MPTRAGKRYCNTPSLAGLYGKPGGMPYVPWTPGTEGLFPPMVRSEAYPPPREQEWVVGN